MTDLKPRRHLDGGHGIHPYFGKVDPALAHALISIHSNVNDTVLDPFCGSGTVLHEAILHGRQAVGWDSSPLAVMIATAKLVGTNAETNDQLMRCHSSLVSHDPRSGLYFKPVESCIDYPTIPRVRNVERWFSIEAVSELSWIKQYIENYECSLHVRLLLYTAFSRVITRSSNQEGESSYRCVVKPSYVGRVIEMFRDSIMHVARIAERYETQRATSLSKKLTAFEWAIQSGSEIGWGQHVARLGVSDARSSRCLTPFAHLVVTSPPYLMSWDYGLYHKFRFYWLGLDLNSYEETEIGRHLRRRNDDLPRYKEDMQKVFRSLASTLFKNGKIAMINANSILHGKTVDTNSVLAECADEYFELVSSDESIAIPGPHHGMYASLASRNTQTAGKSGKKEHVLIFRKRC